MPQAGARGTEINPAEVELDNISIGMTSNSENTERDGTETIM